MSPLPALLTLAGSWALVVISPGPCFLATVQASTHGGRRQGVRVAWGIAVGTFTWCVASLLGLALLFSAWPAAYQALRLGGAACLVYLGLKALGWAARPHPRGPAETRPASAQSAFHLGLLTDLSNPKAAVFFSSLFAGVLPAATPRG